MKSVKFEIRNLIRDEKLVGELLGVGLKPNKVPEDIEGSPNPYWVFIHTTSRGLLHEYVEARSDWTWWHECWYQIFMYRHALKSGGWNVRRLKDIYIGNVVEKYQKEIKELFIKKYGSESD